MTAHISLVASDATRAACDAVTSAETMIRYVDDADRPAIYAMIATGNAMIAVAERMRELIDILGPAVASLHEIAEAHR